MSTKCYSNFLTIWSDIRPPIWFPPLEKCFTKNDIIFANRPRLLLGKHLSYNYTTIGSAPYGPHWRNLRRFSTLEIFSTTKLNTFLSIRQEETRSLLKKLFRDSQQSFAKVEMKSRLSELSFNIIMRMVEGKTGLRFIGISGPVSFFAGVQAIQQLSTITADAFNQTRNERATYQFLMGLDDKYATLHTQIINMDPFPNIDRVYAMVMQEESHRGITGSCDTTSAVGFHAQNGPPTAWSSGLVSATVGTQTVHL
ncbi:hypothetical protein RJ639_022658 [Escallonia herrerae]|uniref:Cytochrome P450 n=1 Tax=Escallonia herrerae TaxID=1293975 RepID=A0AA88V0J6_9ASTE|nr:hypothetical protein RJ639_022658 [Escallonia herrerae]